jgi:bifunctional non-homologous end joining protein LigD
LIVGLYEGKQLLYASRVRAGFVPASRRKISKLTQNLIQKDCPFKNLPEAHGSRWGQGLTKAGLRMPETATRRPDRFS